MAEFDFSIRPAVPADAPTIAEYNARLAAETEDTLLDREVLNAGVRAILADNSKGRYFVAESAGEIVGQCMITYEWSDWRSGTIWWFQSVYVASAWRRHGIFRALFQHVMQAGEEAGAVGFRLYAVDSNAPALETYARLGMQATHYVVMERLTGKPPESPAAEAS